MDTRRPRRASPVVITDSEGNHLNFDKSKKGFLKTDEPDKNQNVESTDKSVDVVENTESKEDNVSKSEESVNSVVEEDKSSETPQVDSSTTPESNIEDNSTQGESTTENDKDESIPVEINASESKVVKEDDLNKSSDKVEISQSDNGVEEGEGERENLLNDDKGEDVDEEDFEDSEDSEDEEDEEDDDQDNENYAENARKVYTNDFLLSLKPTNSTAPPELSNISFNISEKSKSNDRQPRESNKRKGGKNRRNRNVDRTPKQRVVPELSENEKIIRQATSILNKLVPEVMDKLTAQLKELNLTLDLLETVAEKIFDKALSEPKYCNMYSELCFSLSKDGTTQEYQKKFRTILLGLCQREFENRKNHVFSDDPAIREEESYKMRMRMRGNMDFVGSLYKRQGLLPEKVVKMCFLNLLTNPPDSTNLEAFCKLMTSAGAKFDTPKNEQTMLDIFKRLDDLAFCNDLEPRIRFMIRDVMDLRKNKWEHRRKREVAKTIDEVHKDIEKDKKEKARALQRPSRESRDKEPKSNSRGPKHKLQSSGDSWNTPSPKSRNSKQKSKKQPTGRGSSFGKKGLTSSSDKVNTKKKPERKATKEINATLSYLFEKKDYENAYKNIETEVLPTADRGVKEQTLFINDVFDYVWEEKKDANVVVPLFKTLCEKKILSPIGMGKGFTDVVRKVDNVNSTNAAFQLGNAIGDLQDNFRDIKFIAPLLVKSKKETRAYIVGGIHEVLNSKKQGEVKLGFGEDYLKEYTELIKSNSEPSENDNTEKTQLSSPESTRDSEFIRKSKNLTNTTLEELYGSQDFEEGVECVKEILTPDCNDVSDQARFIVDVFDFAWSKRKDHATIVKFLQVLLKEKIISPIGLTNGFSDVIKKLDEVVEIFPDGAVRLGRTIARLENEFRAGVKFVPNLLLKLDEYATSKFAGALIEELELLNPGRDFVKLGFAENHIIAYKLATLKKKLSNLDDCVIWATENISDEERKDPSFVRIIWPTREFSRSWVGEEISDEDREKEEELFTKYRPLFNLFVVSPESQKLLKDFISKRPEPQSKRIEVYLEDLL